VFGEDIDGMIEDIRKAVATFETALVSASQNFEVVSQEILLASQSASKFTQVLESVAVANKAQMSRFLQYGLPEFLKFTEDAGQLVRNLQRFIDRIDRDPARYFLGTQGSEFSR
jgi:phospholipid/cholesterol/gamma-HCH transport system substrate-binding protein